MPSSLEIFKAEHVKLFSEFHWRSDEDTYKQIELWTRPLREGSKLVGDCDDWVMEMDFRCRARGIPLEETRFAVCKINDRTNVLYNHVALILFQNEKLYVSECNSRTVVELHQLPYTDWYVADSSDITSRWVAI